MESVRWAAVAENRSYSWLMTVPSVRESLELLIRCAGWQPETFTSAEECLASR